MNLKMLLKIKLNSRIIRFMELMTVFDGNNDNSLVIGLKLNWIKTADRHSV
jgi:hypothetical protein